MSTCKDAETLVSLRLQARQLRESAARAERSSDAAAEYRRAQELDRRAAELEAQLAGNTE